MKCKTEKERWSFERIISICEQLKQRLGGKPDNLLQKMIDGKVNKFNKISLIP